MKLKHMISLLLVISFAFTFALACPSQAAQKPFEGKEIVISGCAGQLKVIGVVAEPWEEMTGAKVVLNEVSLLELREKYVMSLRAGVPVGDILYMASDMGGDVMGAGYALPIPAEIKEKLDWEEDILKPYRDQQLDWGGVTYGWPLDGDLLNLYYRKDILTNPEYKKRFNEKYGRELQVPKTWEEYEEVAEFFTGWDWDGDGKVEYGCVELPMRKNQLWNGFMSRAVAYAKHPENLGFCFDPDTMEAEINNPGFIKALEDWVRVLNNYAPPGVLSYGWMENAQSFIGGETALDIQWGDIGPMSLDPEMSVVAHKVGFDLLPGHSDVWNYKTKRWETVDGINQPAYLGFGGWINVVPKTAPEPEIAFDFLAYLSSPEVLKELSLMSGSGINPCRKSTMEDIEAWVKSGFTHEEAEEYLGAIKGSLSLPDFVFQLRIPGFAEYQRILELYVAKALAGEVNPTEALNKVAEEWEELTNILGRDQQRRLYREALGLDL